MVGHDLGAGRALECCGRHLAEIERLQENVKAAREVAVVPYDRGRIALCRQATHLRVEKTAREKLQMRTATPAVTTYVTDPAAVATSGAGR